MSAPWVLRFSRDVRDSDMSKHGKFFALTAATYADMATGDNFFVSDRRMADDMDVSLATAVRGRRECRERGVLIDTGKRRGRGGAIVYRLFTPKATSGQNTSSTNSANRQNTSESTSVMPQTPKCSSTDPRPLPTGEDMARGAAPPAGGSAPLADERERLNAELADHIAAVLNRYTADVVVDPRVSLAVKARLSPVELVVALGGDAHGVSYVSLELAQDSRPLAPFRRMCKAFLAALREWGQPFELEAYGMDGRASSPADGVDLTAIPPNDGDVFTPDDAVVRLVELIAGRLTHDGA